MLRSIVRPSNRLGTLIAHGAKDDSAVILMRDTFR